MGCFNHKQLNYYLSKKNYTMKKTAFFILCVSLWIFSKTTLNAQVVFSSNSKYDAQIKVFVSSSKYEADLVVYKANSKYECGENNGVWFFSNSKYEAKKTIFFVDSKYEADLIIYFTNSKYEAGWRNNSKKHLMY
jgi:hypothetical protein